MLGNLPVTVFNKCYLLMLTCILKTVKKKKKQKEFAFNSHFKKSLFSACFVPGHWEYKSEQDMVTIPRKSRFWLTFPNF